MYYIILAIHSPLLSFFSTSQYYNVLGMQLSSVQEIQKSMQPFCMTIDTGTHAECTYYLGKSKQVDLMGLAWSINGGHTLILNDLNFNARSKRP